MGELLFRAGLLALCGYALVVAAVMAMFTGLMVLCILTGNVSEPDEDAVVFVLQLAASLVMALAIAAGHFLFAAATLKAAFLPWCDRCELRRTSMKRPSRRVSTRE
jgi:hypothetical protein